MLNQINRFSLSIVDPSLCNLFFITSKVPPSCLPSSLFTHSMCPCQVHGVDAKTRKETGVVDGQPACKQSKNFHLFIVLLGACRWSSFFFSFPEHFSLRAVSPLIIVITCALAYSAGTCPDYCYYTAIILINDGNKNTNKKKR